MSLVCFIAAVLWFGQFLGVAFFDYEPSKFVVGAAFFFSAVDSLKDAAHYITNRV